ncbi:MAG: glutamate synthase subunit alpha, partial [Polyangiales bacterium]
MSLPRAQGLYDPRFEHDACGLGFVATLRGPATHDVVRRGLVILANLTHRGAAGCDPCTGDGAGVLLQLPHALFADDFAARGITLPPPGDYAVACCFFAPNPGRRRRQEALLERSVLHYGQRVIGWRDVPVDPTAIGPVARASMPTIRQLFIGRRVGDGRDLRGAAFERVLFMIRKRAGRTASERLGSASTTGSADDFYIASCSSKTLVYKGLMLAEQL